MALDCVNIFETRTWTSKDDATVTVDYRPFSGPLSVTSTAQEDLNHEVIRAYLNRCIVRVTNVNIPTRELVKHPETGKSEWVVTTKHYDEWRHGRDPEVNWADVLPPREANELWVLIAAFSRLSAEARRDS